MTSQIVPARGLRSFISTVRAGLTGLTLRGRAIATSGVAVAGSAALLGQRDLMQVGLALALLPLVAAALLASTGTRLISTRSLAPLRAQPGEPVGVTLTLRNAGNRRTPRLFAADQLLWSEYKTFHGVINSLGRGASVDLTYRVAAPGRGRYRMGPLEVITQDLFGLCEYRRGFSAVDSLAVLPVVVPLEAIEASASLSTGGAGRRDGTASGGGEDAGVREYRVGDDLRRVHWKTTARRGELMVRQDEQPRRRRATIVLDTRDTSYADPGGPARFEWLVSAAASVALAMSESGCATRLLMGTGPSDWAPAGLGFTAGALDPLIDVQPVRGDPLDRALTTMTSDPGEPGMVIALLGSADPGVGHRLATGLSRGGRGLVLVCAQQHDPADLFTLSGTRWKVRAVTPDQRLDAQWSSLIRTAS